MAITRRTIAENEVIGVCIAMEAIMGMANHAMLRLLPDEPLAEAEVRFHTAQHQQLFLARLLDFVDEKADAKLTGVKGSCLDILLAASATMAFNVSDSVLPLRLASQEFDTWLSAKRRLKLWLPTLDIQAELEVPRRELLFIAGNQSKHNLARLTRVSERIASLLRDHGHDVRLDLVPLALDDFREHLQEGYFVYYGTWITEYLTRLHWGVHHYLRPTFEKSYKPSAADDFRYSYSFPLEIKDDIAREWFWRLMNHVRSGPFISPFSAPRYMKEENI